MKDHMKRVVNERDDLADKLRKLRDFLLCETYGTLDAAEQQRLAQQVMIMALYEAVLTARIEAVYPPSENVADEAAK